MTRDETLRFVAQEDARGEHFRALFGQEWVVVRGSEEFSWGRIGFGSAILPKEVVPRALEEPDWEFTGQMEGRPGFATQVGPEGRHTHYLRFGNDQGIEPLVLDRHFSRVIPPSYEVCEEFRLFHDLASLDSGRRLSRLADDGEWDDVVRIGANRVEVRRLELLEYVTAKGMILGLYVDRVRYGRISPPLRDDEKILDNDRSDSHVYELHLSHWADHRPDGRNIFSRLLGKVLIQGGPEWDPMRERDRGPFEEFIVGVDQNGSAVKRSCDPRTLERVFPIPVFFRRAVLQKYYADTSRYTVDDSCVRRAGVWRLHIDNNHRDYVIVYLDDLGTLPAGERAYWLSFNVKPDGEMSETYRRRTMLGEWTEPVGEDHIFRHAYERFNEQWLKVHGWPLFRMLDEGDAHLLGDVRVPLTESQGEFDGQVGVITKLMVDYLNEGALAGAGIGVASEAKGIVKLEAYLSVVQAPDGNQIVDFLRKLQRLRSAGAAHGKGERFKKAIKALDLEGETRANSFRRILVRATDVLRMLGSVQRSA